MIRNIASVAARYVAEHFDIPAPPAPPRDDSLLQSLSFRYRWHKYRANLQEQKEEQEQQVSPADGGSWSELYGQPDG